VSDCLIGCGRQVDPGSYHGGSSQCNNEAGAPGALSRLCLENGRLPGQIPLKDSHADGVNSEGQTAGYQQDDECQNLLHILSRKLLTFPGSNRLVKSVLWRALLFYIVKAVFYIVE